jgi:hypothetical protein
MDTPPTNWRGDVALSETRFAFSGRRTGSLRDSLHPSWPGAASLQPPPSRWLRWSRAGSIT